MYRFYAELAGASVTEIAYEGDDLHFPTGRLLQAITPQTKAVLIANPNNPTGTAATVAELERVLKRARKAVVLVDEAYVEFCGISALPLVVRYANLFVSRTFSKTYGMAAMRMGCLVSRAGNIAVLRKAQSPYSVNLLASMAMQEAIRDQAYIRRYVAEVLAARELLCLGLDKLGIAYVPSQANFVLMRCGRRSVEVRDRLRERNVLVRDRSYEIAGCVRVTVGTREQTRRFLAALREIW
jgi:histidinol-phosphate aminotransferase